MIKNALFMLLLQSLTTLGMSAEAPVKDPAIASQVVNPEMNKLMAIPDVAKKYEECKLAIKDDAKLNEIPECMWNGLPSASVKELDPDLKKKVKDEYAKTQTIQTEGGGEKKDLTLDQSTVSSTFVGHPGYSKLTEIVKKQIDDGLKGSNYSDKKVSSVDHVNFSRLYNTELSKSVVDALSSYCMKVDYSKTIVEDTQCSLEKKCSDKTDPAVKGSCIATCSYYTYLDKQDGERLSKIVLDAISSGGTQDVNGVIDYNDNGTNYKVNVNACLASVPAACTDTNHKNKEAQQFACTIVEYLKATRKNLILNEKISKVYETIGPTVNLEISNLNEQVKINQEKMITVTSKDVDESYSDANKKLMAETDSCKVNPEQAVCGKLLDTNLTDKQKSVAEFGLRQFAQGEALQAEIDNKEGLKKYLLAEGYSEKEANEYLKDDTQIPIIKQRIADKYKTQKAALIQELADRVNATTSSKNGAIQATDTTKISVINSELTNKTENLKRLVRFNNIASAYLKIDDKGGRSPASSKSNTTSLQEELAADNKNPSNKNLGKTFKSEISNSDGSDSSKNILGTLKEILGF